MFSCEFCKICKNTFFTKHLWATSSVKGFVICLKNDGDMFQSSAKLMNRSCALIWKILQGELHLNEILKTNLLLEFSKKKPAFVLSSSSKLRSCKVRPEKSYLKSQSPHEIIPHSIKENAERKIQKEIYQTTMMDLFTKIVNVLEIAAHTRIW